MPSCPAQGGGGGGGGFARCPRRQLLLAILAPACCYAANFAQITGPPRQNVIKVSDSAWSERWGMAATALDYSAEEELETGRTARIFVIGGDTYDDQHGGGGFRNDVYSMTKPTWQRYLHPLEKNKRGDAQPRLVSKAEWTQVTSGRTPSRKVPYSYWISCSAESVQWRGRNPDNCDVIYAPPGQYLLDIMFSPRRNHRAVAIGKDVYVLGGRAREGNDMPEHETIGGILGSGGGRHGRMNVAEGHVWREKVMLKNDVWKSTDGGTQWDLMNPGCGEGHQLNMTRKAGNKHAQCRVEEANNDCYGDADCVLGTCICRMWSPRELFATVEYEQTMYISGGFSDRQVHNCGVETTTPPQGNTLPAGRQSGEEYACGGGYRGYMRDVWRSNNGIQWESLTIKAPWKGRGEHAMFMLEGSFFVTGGRAGHTWEDRTEEYRNDLWQSNDLCKTWIQLEDANWSPRSAMAVVVIKQSVINRIEQVYIFGGKNESEGRDREFLNESIREPNYLNEVWSWSGNQDQGWIKDYVGNAKGTLCSVDTDCYGDGTCVSGMCAPSSIKDYVTLDSPIEMLRLKMPMSSRDATFHLPPKFRPSNYLQAKDVFLLKSRGIHTIEQLANMKKEDVLHFRLPPAVQDDAGPTWYTKPETGREYCGVLPNFIEEFFDYKDGQHVLARMERMCRAQDKAMCTTRPVIVGGTPQVSPCHGGSEGTAMADRGRYLLLYGDIPCCEWVAAEETRKPPIEHVCELKWLAQAVVNKCSVHDDTWDVAESELTDANKDSLNSFTGREDDYGKLVLENGYITHLSHGGLDELSPEGGAGFQFNNQGGMQYNRQVEDTSYVPPEEVDEWQVQVDNWDGCEMIGVVGTDDQGREFYDDVEGIPQVQVDTRKADFQDAVWRLEEEIHCRWVFSPRAYAQGVLFQQRAYVMGGLGKDSKTNMTMDNTLWYRDDTPPTTSFTLTPPDDSSHILFTFICDEDACLFEYRVNDYSENNVVCNWTRSAGEASLPWLGGGIHRMRVRAIDAAGNVENTFEAGRNELLWLYTPPLPIALILGCVSGFLFFCAGVYLEYRRRRRKAAMERYAIKRMRRKFKGAKKEKEVDWKKYGKGAKAKAKAGAKRKDKGKGTKEKKNKKQHGKKGHKHGGKHKHAHKKHEHHSKKKK